MARGWLTASKQPVANRDLWEQLQTLMQKHTVTVTWIPREQNAEADGLAQEARLNHGMTPTTTKPARQITHLMIAGSRDATPQMLDYARRAVRRAHECGYTVIVGDNPKGVDMAVVRECRRLKTPVIVAGVDNFPRNGGCKHGQYVKVYRDTYRAASGYLLNRYTYGGKSTTFILHVSDEQATAQLHQHVTKLVNVPVFPEWTGYLWHAGQSAMLVRKTRGAGGLEIFSVDLDVDSWTRLVTGGLANKVIELPQNHVE